MTARACLSAQRFADLGEMAVHLPLSLIVVVDEFETAAAWRQNLKTSFRASRAISLLIGIPILISAGVALTQTVSPASKVDIPLSTTRPLLPGGSPDPDRVFDCLDRTTTSFEATALDTGGRATLSWVIHPPRECTIFRQVILGGVTYGLSGSVVVQPLVTTSYPLTLIFPGGSKEMARVTVNVKLPDTVN